MSSSVEVEKEGKWVEKYSKTHSLPYWFNTQTEQSVWENPSPLSVLNQQRKPEESKTKVVNESAWQEKYSTTHKAVYWFNPMTNESVWTDPTGKKPSASPHANQAQHEDINEEQPHKKRRGNPSSASSSSCTGSAVSAALAEVIEDHPSLALERERLREQCHHLLVDENAKYGTMRGSTKTAISCRKDGDAVGMQGVFARIMWHQLLCEIDTNGDIGSSMQRDGIFPMTTVDDEAVTKELIDAGRSVSDSNKIIQTVLDAMRKACKQLADMRRIAASNSSAVTLSTEASNIVEGVKTQQRQVFYSLRFGQKAFSVSAAHLEKLLRLYKIHTDKTATLENSLFLRRAFCVIHRYESLSGASDGYQMAFPHSGFQWLRDNVGVEIECFASPLNCWNQRMCSVARDTDQFFGSMGNFFLFDGSCATGKVSATNMGLPQGGSFEANPPFVESVMNRMAHHIEKILTSFANRDDVPFSFSVIVPAWTDCEGINVMTNSKFLRPQPKYVLRLEKRKHNYRPGMQHRTTHEEQPSNVDTLVFFLQNNAGAKKWPVTAKMAETLKTRLNEDTLRT